ncbi:MAG: hypothetical protein WA658_00830 [Candidatus Acidiferrales bacterium]
MNIEFQGRVLLVTASGPVALDAALRRLKRAFDAAKEKEVSKILVNTIAVSGELSTFERYTLGVEVVAYLRLHEMNPKVAFAGKLPTNRWLRRARRPKSKLDHRSIFQPGRCTKLAWQLAGLSASPSVEV